MTVEIVFETHSISTDNEIGVATGWLDGALSERGAALARALGERRRDDGIDAVVSSDLARARQTTEIAFGESGIPVCYDWRLRECNYGDWNGMPVTTLCDERGKRIRSPFPGGESYEDVINRMTAFLLDLARDHDGRRVVVIGHSATRWALDHLLGGHPLRHVVEASFDWQEGWTYLLPGGWRPAEPDTLTLPTEDGSGAG